MIATGNHFYLKFAARSTTSAEKWNIFRKNNHVVPAARHFALQNARTSDARPYDGICPINPNIAGSVLDKNFKKGLTFQVLEVMISAWVSNG